MKLIINKGTIKRIKELTDKDVKEIKVYKDDQIVATESYSDDFEPGVYNLDIELIYKDNKIDKLENQTVEIKFNDKILNLTYIDIKFLMLAIVLNPWFWIAIVLSIFISGLLGVSGIFLYAICATFAMNNPQLYKRNGIKIFKVK